MTGESACQNIDDATITSQVKTKLAAERASNLTRVSVATADGMVSLTGIMPTVADRARAEEITRQVKGVRSRMLYRYRNRESVGDARPHVRVGKRPRRREPGDGDFTP